jgi:hypothetical protein
VCDPDLGGSFLVIMFGQDENGEQVVLSVGVSNTGGEVVVQVGNPFIPGELWIADPSVHDDYPQHTLPQEIGATAEVSGNSVSGSGVFYEDRSLSETRQSGEPYDTGVLDGTFSVTCPAS